MTRASCSEMLFFAQESLTSRMISLGVFSSSIHSLIISSTPDLEIKKKNHCYFEKINYLFLTFPARFQIPVIFSNLNYNCSNLSDLRNLHEQVKKAFCYQKLIRLFTVRINYSKVSSSYHLFVKCFSQLSFDSEVYTKSAATLDAKMIG